MATSQMAAGPAQFTACDTWGDSTDLSGKSLATEAACLGAGSVYRLSSMVSWADWLQLWLQLGILQTYLRGSGACHGASHCPGRCHNQAIWRRFAGSSAGEEGGGHLPMCRWEVQHLA